MNPFDSIANRLGKTMWVVLVKDAKGKLTLLADPGMGMPWHAKGPNPLRNQRTAEFHAKECDGMACTWSDAFALLRKENPQFEKQLHDNLKVKARIIENNLRVNKQTGLITDQHGRPVDPPSRA